MTTPEVSHGRGGAGNIHADETKYVDGSVVRTGVEGSHGDGAYSVGRGGEFPPLCFAHRGGQPSRASLQPKHKYNTSGRRRVPPSSTASVTVMGHGRDHVPLSLPRHGCGTSKGSSGHGMGLGEIRG